MSTLLFLPRAPAQAWIILLLVFSTITSHGALTLVAREPFVGPGTLTSAAPGSNFSSVTGTLTEVAVGARPATVTAPGWSADLRNATGSISWGGTFAVNPGNASMFGVWIRIKALPAGAASGYSYLLTLNNYFGAWAYLGINGNGNIFFQPNGGAETVSSFVVPLNTWTFVALEWKYAGSNPNGTIAYQVGAQTLGGAWNGGVLGSAGTSINDVTVASITVGMQVGGTGPSYRISCPSLYSMGSYTADWAYPADIVAPVEQSYAWYVNPSTGSDSNPGTSPGLAWQTAAKINTESQYGGMLDSNAPGPGGGDVLTIDTSGGPLVIGGTTLTFSTQGLKVQPASGQNYIKFQAEEFLANAGFTATAGLAKTYQTPDTQANIVAWENDEWMWHVKSASFGAAAAITNPDNGVTTNYPTTGAALDAVPGSFYTDGTNLYVHPFNDTNPSTDGNTYTRSINRNQLAAVDFAAGNYRAIGFYIRKTALADPTDNVLGAYCFQDGVNSGNGLSSSVEGGYFAYGDKHCFGSTCGVTDSSLLVLNTECEQGQPYCGYGGQSPFVSFSSATTGDNVHTYRGCTCLARSGLIGSTAGDPVGTGGDIILSHNNGTGLSFASITIDDCNFASGNIDLGVASSILITDQTQTGGVLTSCPSTTIQETSYSSPIAQKQPLVQMVSGTTSLTMQNCLIKPVFDLGTTAPIYYGLILSGNVTIEGCTFDFSGITGDSSSYFQQGMLQRAGALNLTFRNNAYVVPSGENLPLLYGAAQTDTLTFDHNAYNLGGGTTLARDYGDPGASLTFAQWQALGEDCANSTLNANLLLQGDVPQSGSPLFNAGVDLGAGPDVTGTVYPHRDTIGAYEGSAAYLAPQTIASFPPLLTTAENAPVSLPDTTSAGLAITYTLVSGPAQLDGTTLNFTGTGTVVITATQAGDSGDAPLSETENITVTAPLTDTPTLPVWGLILLAGMLVALAGRSLPRTSGS
jgi:hypothetical protein